MTLTPTHVQNVLVSKNKLVCMNLVFWGCIEFTVVCIGVHAKHAHSDSRSKLSGVWGDEKTKWFISLNDSVVNCSPCGVHCLICESLSDASRRRDMDELDDVHKRERENLQLMEEQRERAYRAYRLHHLVSTKQVCPQKTQIKSLLYTLTYCNCFTAIFLLTWGQNLLMYHTTRSKPRNTVHLKSKQKKWQINLLMLYLYFGRSNKVTERASLWQKVNKSPRCHNAIWLLYIRSSWQSGLQWTDCRFGLNTHLLKYAGILCQYREYSVTCQKSFKIR